MYDEDKTQQAQLTVSGSSHVDGFDCDIFLGSSNSNRGSDHTACPDFANLVNAAATAVDVAPPVAGALAFVSLGRQNHPAIYKSG